MRQLELSEPEQGYDCTIVSMYFNDSERFYSLAEMRTGERETDEELARILIDAVRSRSIALPTGARVDPPHTATAKSR